MATSTTRTPPKPSDPPAPDPDEAKTPPAAPDEDSEPEYAPGEGPDDATHLLVLDNGDVAYTSSPVATVHNGHGVVMRHLIHREED